MVMMEVIALVVAQEEPTQPAEPASRNGGTGVSPPAVVQTKYTLSQRLP